MNFRVSVAGSLLLISEHLKMQCVLVSCLNFNISACLLTKMCNTHLHYNQALCWTPKVIGCSVSGWGTVCWKKLTSVLLMLLPPAHCRIRYMYCVWCSAYGPITAVFATSWLACIWATWICLFAGWSPTWKTYIGKLVQGFIRYKTLNTASKKGKNFDHAWTKVLLFSSCFISESWKAEFSVN